MVMGWDDALILGAISAGGTAASANAQANAAQSNNSANMEVAAIGNVLNIQEAEKARHFNSLEAEYAFTRSQQAAAEQRGWSAQQAEIARNYNTDSTNAANAFNNWQGDKERAFQEQMSNTQYQRAVGDMQAAGLNPMLAYSQGGAGNLKGASVSGAAAQSVGPPAGASAQSAQASSGAQAAAITPRLENLGQGPYAAAASAFSNMAQLRQIDASTKLTEAQAEKTRADAGVSADDLKLRKHTFDDRVKGVKSESDTKYNQARIGDIEHDIKEYERLHAKGALSTQELNQQYIRANTRLTELGIPGAENEAKFAQQTGVAPLYTKWLGNVVNSASSLIRGGKENPNRSYNETRYDKDGNVSGGISRNYPGDRP